MTYRFSRFFILWMNSIFYCTFGIYTWTLFNKSFIKTMCFLWMLKLTDTVLLNESGFISMSYKQTEMQLPKPSKIIPPWFCCYEFEIKVCLILTLPLLNTTCPVLVNSADPDQLASSEANWSGSALFVIKYVNFYQKPGSSNLIGWKSEVGVAS